MPKEVHDLVDKLLKKKDFYPEKSQKEREDAAWGIAQIQTGHGEKHEKSNVEADLCAIANALDEAGLHKQADIVTEVLKRVADARAEALSQER